MATGGSDLTSDESLGIKCCICAEENRCREADKYCVQCKDYYCLTCVGAHTRIPALRGHKLLEKSDFTSLGQDGSLPSFPTHGCPQHQNEVINMYCKDHDEVTCAPCIALCHRICKDIHSIPEEVDILYNKADMKPVEKKIKALKSKMEELKKSKEENIKSLERSLNEAIETVNAFRREIKTILEEIETETLREIRACFSRLQKSLDEDNKEVEAMIDSLNEALLQLNKAQGNVAQEFVSLKNCEKVATKAEAVDEAQRKHRETTFYFYPDPQVKEYFDRKQIFGKVVFRKPSLYKVKLQKEVDVRLPNSLDDDKVEVRALIDSRNEALLQLNKAQGNMAQEFVSLKNCEKVATKAEAVDEAQRKHRDTTFFFNPVREVKQYFVKKQTFGKVVCPKQSLYNVKLQKDVNVKLPSDTRTSCIWGSCITEDGYLLLADFDNKRLKRLLLSAETVKDYIDCKYKSTAVCQIDKTEAAVAQLNKTVQFISLADTMNITRTLTMNHHCHGIAHAVGKLFITDEKKAVYIHDLNGLELRKITTDSAGVDIFFKAKHVCISASGVQVFVADFNNGLICLDIEGNYLFTIQDKRCKGYFDACSDQTNVFVCGFDSNNIIQIGPGNTVLGEIAKVPYPLSVCYDTHKGRLIVSSNNTIKILELE